MRATVIINKKKDFYWLLVLILFIIPLLIEFFAGDILFQLSCEPIISLQNFFYSSFDLKIFNNEEQELTNVPNSNINSNLYSFLEENSNTGNDEDGNPSNVAFSEFFHLINTNTFYMIFCTILLNFMNVYKVFILSMIIFGANGVSSLFCYIYHSPKPYMAFYKIRAALIFNEWGSPNTQIVVLVSFYLSFYMIIRGSRFLEVRLVAKIIIFVILILYMIFDILILFASGNCSFNQLIFSLFIGVAIFIFVFYVIKLNPNQPKQFIKFIKFNSLYYICANILIFVLQILLNVFINDGRDNVYFGNHAVEQSSRMPSTDFYDNYLNYRQSFDLDYGNFCNVICFIMNVVAFLALKLDYRYLYNKDYKLWSENYFEKESIEERNNREGEFVTEDTQWNHNGVCFSIIRMFLLIIFILVCLVPLLWIKSRSDSEFHAFVFIVMIPLILLVFGNFFAFKALLIKIKLGRGPKIEEKNIMD